MRVEPDSAQDRLARKRSLSRRGFAYRLLGAVGLIVLTLEIGDRPGLEVTEVLSGLAAVVAVVGAIDAGVRAYRINLGAQSRPKIVTSRLPDDRSLAYGSLLRLAARERELADHVAVLPTAVSADTWRRASGAARALRTYAERLTVAETRAQAGSGANDLDLLSSRLREGVSAYERLTSTAAELAAHGSGTAMPATATFRMSEATDALVGMIRGLAS